MKSRGRLSFTSRNYDEYVDIANKYDKSICFFSYGETSKTSFTKLTLFDFDRDDLNTFKKIQVLLFFKIFGNTYTTLD